MRHLIFKVVIVISVLIFHGITAFAQFEAATEKVLGLYAHMATLLKYVLGIGALCTLVGIVINLMKGEKESAEKLIYWTLGLSVGFTLIAILEANMPNWVNSIV